MKSEVWSCVAVKGTSRKSDDNSCLSPSLHTNSGLDEYHKNNIILGYDFIQLVGKISVSTNINSTLEGISNNQAGHEL